MSSLRVTAARGVAGPGVGSLGGCPGDRLVVIAESIGHDRGGHFENPLPDHADSGRDCGNTERSDQCAEGFRVHWLACAAGGEQPTGIAVGGGVHVG